MTKLIFLDNFYYILAKLFFLKISWYKSGLIQKYEPILYFHENEDFYPTDINSFVANSWLLNSKDKSEENGILQPSVVAPWYFEKLRLDQLTPNATDISGFYLQFTYPGLYPEDLPGEDLVDPVEAKTKYQELVDGNWAHPTYYGLYAE